MQQEFQQFMHTGTRPAKPTNAGAIAQTMPNGMMLRVDDWGVAKIRGAAGRARTTADSEVPALPVWSGQIIAVPPVGIARCLTGESNLPGQDPKVQEMHRRRTAADAVGRMRARTSLHGWLNGAMAQGRGAIVANQLIGGVQGDEQRLLAMAGRQAEQVSEQKRRN